MMADLFHSLFLRKGFSRQVWPVPKVGSNYPAINDIRTSLVRVKKVAKRDGASQEQQRVGPTSSTQIGRRRRIIRQ